MANERGIRDASSEAWLALARVRSGKVVERSEIVRLSVLSDRNNLALTELWLELGDHEAATRHALDAYTYAWADGEPYVRRFDLTRATDLLHRLGAPIPDLPPFDPSAHPSLPWEAEVKEAIVRALAP